MGRKRALTDEQVNEIFNNPETSAKEFASRFGVSYVTILKVRKGKGAYTPVENSGLIFLNSNGEEVGREEAPV
jgi:hypothetical protein